jgi:PAS domain S-box-containing protein
MSARKKVKQQDVSLPNVISLAENLFEVNKKKSASREEFKSTQEKWEALKKALAQITAHEEMLLDTARYLTSNLDEKEILTRIANGAMRVLHADEADIYLLSEDGDLLQPMVAIGPQYIQEILSAPLKVGASLTGKAVRQKHSVIVNDIRDEADAYQVPGTPVDTEERLIIAPLTDEDDVIGALCITRLGALFSMEDLKLAEAYAAFASSVLVNVNTHTDLEKEVKERTKAEGALRESEKKYRELTDFLPQIIFEMDLKGRFTFVNRFAFSTMGFTYEDFEKGLNAYDFIEPEDRERAEANLSRLIETGTYPAQEFRIIRKDGSRFHAIFLASPILVRKQPIGFRGVIIDISARKQVDEALKQSEESYHGLFNSVDDAIYIQDEDGKFLDVNEGTAKMYGYSRGEMIGRILEDIEAEGKNDLEKIYSLVRKAFKGEPQQYEFWGMRKKGQVFLQDVRLYQGTYYGKQVVISVATDITKRRMAENALKESEARYRQLVELSPDAIAIHSGGKFVYINPAGLKMLGAKSREDIIGKPVLSIVAPGYIDVVKNQLKFAEQNRKYQPPVIEQFIRLNKSIIDAEVVSIPITFDGKLAWQMVAHDISEQVRAQLKEQQATEELFKAYEATLEGWSHALEMRERETAGHSRRVADITVALCKKMGVPSDQLIQIRRGAILHDIGKLSIPDRILLKPEPLTKEEWVIMRQHPVFAFELLSPIKYLTPALEIPCNHHERWDGTGYPNGIKGEEIPLSARIFSVVDEWDALTSDRPYRRAWTKEAARQYLRDQRGKIFDPKVVDAFLKLMVVTGEFQKLGASK